MTWEDPLEIKRIKHLMISGRKKIYEERKKLDPFQGLAGGQIETHGTSA